MKKTVLFIILIVCGIFVFAQNTMRIHLNGGTHLDVPFSQVDSVTFVDVESDTLSVADAELLGEWLWGSDEAGYYEVLTFNADYTYTGYDNYFLYGFDTRTYGWYSRYGSMLTLWSNGIGYQYRYNWFVTSLPANSLSVMTKMGPFNYYRVKPDLIKLHVGESLTCDNGDSYVFADGVIARVEGNQLYGVATGETYILKMLDSTQIIVGYKVVIE